MKSSNTDTNSSKSRYATPKSEIISALSTDEAGLSSDEADRRLSEYGTNDIHEAEQTSILDLFRSQFRNPLIYLLAVAALLSLSTGLVPGGEPSYTVTIFIILIIAANGVFGFIQDYQAARSIEALRELATPEATVFRDGDKRSIDAERIVPGDVISLEQGDAVPADAGVLSAEELRTNESPLTGESTPVEKTTEAVDEETPLAERHSMVYKNTTVVKGRGSAVVVETGMETEVGGIATQLHEANDRQTPFQDEVERLGTQIGGLVVSLIVLVVAVQFLFTATEPTAIVLVGITLAVAGVPEGLPAVVTFTLALGAREMVDRNALVRRLPVVESLGSIDVIVTDKTGTVTENRMTVTRLYASGSVFEVSESNSESATVDFDGQPADANGQRVMPNGNHERDSGVDRLLECGTICNNVDRTDDGEYRGDPTEIALQRVADDADLDPPGDRIREIQFSSERKRMTVIVDDREPTAYMKGAPETVLDRCDSVLENGERVPLTDAKRQAILDRTQSFAADALRVLGFASKPVEDPSANEDQIEEEMLFLGLQGMLDPPREEVAEAIPDCRAAGFVVFLLLNVASAALNSRLFGSRQE